MNKIFRGMAGKLPRSWQQELKRFKFGIQIRNRSFKSPEKEFEILEEWVSPGDWVLDIGANVGHYTCRLSGIVGPQGRVIAFEPVPDTFELLVANSSRFPFPNVTFLAAGVSDTTSLFSMAIPTLDSGVKNFYQAHITEDSTGLQILGITVDSLELPEKVALVKVDAEGQDLMVLKGMKNLLERDHPTLIVEAGSSEIDLFLEGFGYSARQLEGSWNRVFSAG